ncbi:hypothetical protein [Paenibacillus sp. USHLN196]|uniref:hypothetical protein n=1 Tax=Paenibacillus sp. USHLN196 TaxID=3081291 RepID=UPI003018D15C
MIKYRYTIEYKEDFNEVIVDLGIDTSLKNGYLISNSLGSDYLETSPRSRKKSET